MYSDDLWTSPFPRKMNLGVWAWFLINTLTSKIMVKGSATYLFFCSKGKYSDSCVRRNMLTQDSLCSLQWPPKPLPSEGHLMTINYSCRHSLWTYTSRHQHVWAYENMNLWFKSYAGKLTWNMKLDFQCQSEKLQSLFLRAKLSDLMMQWKKWWVWRKYVFLS